MTQHAYGCDGLHPGPCPSWIDRFTDELAAASYPDALSGGGAAVSLIGAALLRRLGVDLGEKPGGKVSFEYDEDGGIGPRVVVAFGEAREEAEGKAVLPDAARLVARHRDHAAEVSLKLGRLRELAESWVKGDGWDDPAEMRTEADCGREILAIIGAAMTEATAALPPDGAPLTPGELAAMLGIDSRTVSQLAEDGKIASFRTPGGHRRFARAEAERFKAAYRPEGDWASLADLAAALRVSPHTAQRWVKAGKAAGAVKDGGGQWLIPLATIDAMTGGNAR